MSDMRLAKGSHFSHHLSHPYQEEEVALVLVILAPHPLLSPYILRLESLVLNAGPQLTEGGLTVLVDFQEVGVCSSL